MPKLKSRPDLKPKRSMQLTPTATQLRIIWNHVRLLVEFQMHPSIENKQRIAEAERKFSKAERRQLKGLR